ncbi:hypothetical protein pb186bvf_005230 [Paramecium bursaria]
MFISFSKINSFVFEQLPYKPSINQWKEHGINSFLNKFRLIIKFQQGVSCRFMIFNQYYDVIGLIQINCDNGVPDGTQTILREIGYSNNFQFQTIQITYIIYI